MAIRNINTIQNPTDFSYLSYISNKYMYESLANLGQRFSVKGDSIKSNYFTTASLVNKKPNDFYDENKNVIENVISKLTVINNKLYLQFFNTIDITTPIYQEEFLYTTNNLVSTDAPLRLTTKINGIDYYKENMYIYLDSSKNTLNVASLGCDTEMGIVEINLESYNVDTNTLVQSLKLIDVNDDNYFYMYYIYDELSNDNDVIYVAYKYKINRDTITTLYGDFQNFAISVYNTTIKEYYKEYNRIDITNIFSELLQHGFINCCPTDDNKPISVSYDTDSIKGFYVNGSYGYEFNSVLTFIYNQLVYMYEFIFEYYCDYVYKIDNNQLNKYILYKIFNKAFIDSLHSNINGFEMYIPIDYVFNYYCKDTDSFYVYSNETPVNVFYTINKINQHYIDNFYLTETSNKSNSIILTNHHSIEKVVLYKFSVNYNVSNSQIINNIIVNDLYATPYILDDYWVINNQRTQYKAIGEDANNPNIILLYTKNIALKDSNFTTNDFKVLSTINTELLNSLSWKKERVHTNLLEHIDTSSKSLIHSKDYDSYVLVPDNIASDKISIISKLKGSLIINMSDINNVVADITSTGSISEKDQIKEILGNNSFITSFWVFDNYSYSFTNVTNPSTNNALTLSNLSSINNIIANQTKTEVTNKFKNLNISDCKFTYAVFDTGYTVTKSVFTDIGYAYAVFYNKPIQNLNLNYTSWESDSNTFTNPFIFELRYIDTINSKGIHNSRQFIIPQSGNSNLLIDNNNILTAYQLSLVYPQGGFSSYTYDYTPSLSTPLFNLGEVFTINQNNLNRTNICSLGSNKEIYYSYIGTSIQDKDKSIIHFGTSNLNVNIGTNSLIQSSLTDKFTKHRGVAFDFDEVYINSEVTYNALKNVVNIGGSTYSLDYKYIYETDHNQYASLFVCSNGSFNNYTIGKLSANTNIKEIHTYTTSINVCDNTDKFVIIPISYLCNNAGLLPLTDECIITSNMDIINIPEVANGKYIFTIREKMLDTNIANLTINYKIDNTDNGYKISALDIQNNHYGNEIVPCRVKFYNE